MKKIMILALVLSLYGTAEAFESVTAKELAEWCSTKDNANIALCSGYFMGYLDYNNHQNVDKNCIPLKVKNWDLVEVFLEYSNSQQENTNESAYEAIQNAIEKKWPCEEID